MTNDQRKSSNDKRNGEVKKKDSDSDTCPCGEELTDETKMVCFDSCQQWWHGACANLKGITEEGIAEIKDWKCPYCFVSPHTTVKVLKAAFPSLFGMDIDKPIENAVKAEVKKVIPKIIKAVVQETVKEKNFTKSFADVVKQRQEEFSLQANKTIEKSMTSALQNNQQKILDKASVKQDADNIAREKRKRNVVFSNVPESSLESTDGRYRSDMKKVVKMIQPDENDFIVSCHRAGMKSGDKPRLLIVTMETPDLAQGLHCYGSGRKFIYGDKIEIWCNPDLIKADRVANYHARKLQRERREKNSGEGEKKGAAKAKHTQHEDEKEEMTKLPIVGSEEESSNVDLFSENEHESENDHESEFENGSENESELKPANNHGPF